MDEFESLAKAVPELEAERLERLAKTLSSELARKRASLISGSGLRPPATEREIQAVQRTVRPYKAPGDLLSLYRVTNGEPVGDTLRLGVQLLSTADALKLREALITSEGEGLAKRVVARMLPVALLHGGPIVALLALEDRSAAPLYYVDVHERSLYRIASGIRAFIAVGIRCRDRGLLRTGHSSPYAPHGYEGDEEDAIRAVDPSVYPFRKDETTVFAMDDPTRWPPAN